jgi:hypothetical protein
MNDDVMRAAGFGRQMEMVKEHRCPFCGDKIVVHPHAIFYGGEGQVKTIEHLFRNEKSLREFKISGLCQKCQDKTFGMD